MLHPTLKFGRYAWHLGAVILVVGALLAATGRWLLLNIDDHAGWVEAWLSRTLERPVEIGELRGHWRGWSPSIRINALTIYQQDKSVALLRFEQAHIELSISESFKNRDLRPEWILLSGVKLTLERDMEGNLSVAGMPPSRWPAAQWIEAQKRFDLADAHIEFVDLKNSGRTHSFKDLKLRIQRDGRLRHITGTTVREAGSTEKWWFDVSADSSILESNWNGRIKFEAKNVDAEVIKEFRDIESIPLDHGSLKLAVDSEWAKAKLQRANFVAELTTTNENQAYPEPASSNENTPQQYVVEGSTLRIKDGWSIGTRILQFGSAVFSKESQPKIKVHWGPQQNFLVWQIQDLRIEDFLPLAIEHFDKTEIGKLGLATLSPTGVIASSNLLSSRQNPLFPLSGELELRDLSWQESDDVPSVDGISGVLSFNQTGGRLQFTPNNRLTVRSKRWLEAPVELSNIVGDITWRAVDTDLVFASERLTTDLESISLETIGSVTLVDRATPVLNIFTRIKGGQLNDIRKFVPKNLLPVKGERWARRAFQSGGIDHGVIIFRGAVDDFPFDRHEGIFQVHLNATGADVKYGGKWPLAEGVAGSFYVENRATEFVVDAGRVYSSDVSGSTISIENLFTKKRYVQVSGKSVVSAEEVVQFIDESPLRKTKANRFKELSIEAPFELELDLNLGIFPGGEREVLGVAHFADNRIESGKLKLALERLNGDVSFTRHDWYGEGLTAEFRGNRVGVLLDGGLDDPNYDTQIRLTGTSGADFILEQIATYTPTLAKALKPGDKSSRISGDTAWKAVISLPNTQTRDQAAPKKLNIETSLSGLAIDLPWPFSKDREQTVPLSITVETDPKGARSTQLIFGDRVSAAISQQRNDDSTSKLLGADILFAGAGPPPQADATDIRLRGQLRKLNAPAWQQVFAETFSSGDQDPLRLPVSIDLEVDEAAVFNTVFKPLTIHAEKQTDGWLAHVEGDEISGEISVPKDYALPINLKFSRLALPKQQAATRSDSFDPQKIRPFQLESISTRYGDIDLGKVTVVIEKVPNGIRVAEAVSEHGNFELSARGNWLLSAGRHHSEFDVKVRGNSLAGLLGGFGYEIVNIEGGATDLELNAHWDGTPLQFGLEKLRGHLALSVESGRFLDIEPGGGRLFGLLSLQTLPRRLSLDFNDLFSKGFTFDTIVGNFSIDQGNAYTNSLLMDGPSARIQISGRTGLKDQDYDQHVTVTPALSNSIPVASALFGPAGVGVGAVIYLGQKMFKSIPEQMDKFLKREYSITGEWSAPVIERI